jgi:diguanylate cyclase (GGDEF)-like protein
MRLPYFHSNGELWSADLNLSPLTAAGAGRPLWLAQHESERRSVDARPDPGARTMANMSSGTRLLSRVQFDMHCRRELGAARREQRPLCLMLWAVPELGIYRETFGQKSADTCLRMIGTQVTGTFRRGSDLCARYDESTLGVIIAGLDEEQAGKRVTGVERKVRHLALHNPRGRLSRYLAVHGIAVQAKADESLESLFARGTEALAAATRTEPQELVVSA